MVNSFKTPYEKTKKIIILNDTSNESHHGCVLVMENINKLLKKNNMEVICTNPSGVDWKKNISLLESIPRCDLILVNGEGTLHHAQPVARDLISIAKYVKQNYKIPVVLINTTYEENGDDFAEYTRCFDLIYVRENLSKNELKKYGINSKVVPDMTFYSKFDLSKKVNQNLIGVTDSVYINKSRELFQFALRKNYEYLPILTFPKNNRSIKEKISFMRFMIFRKSIPILLYIRAIFDYRIAKMLHYTCDYHNYIKKISDLDLLIVARYHSLCFALKTLTPFFYIESNSFKMKGLLDDIDIRFSKLLSSNNLENLIPYKFSQEELKNISSYINTAPDRIELMFSEIGRLIKD